LNLLEVFGTDEPVPGLTKENVGQPILCVKFFPESVVERAPETKLLWPPAFASLIGASLKLPSWTSSTCLFEYIPSVKSLFAQFLENVSQKRVLMKELRAILGTPTEYDPVQCRKISFVFDTAGIPVIAHISIPMPYPKEKPVIILASIMHHISGRPINKTYNDYPYSPRWNGKELAKRIKQFLIATIPQFKDRCVQEE